MQESFAKSPFSAMDAAKRFRQRFEERFPDFEFHLRELADGSVWFHIPLRKPTVRTRELGQVENALKFAYAETKNDLQEHEKLLDEASLKLFCRICRFPKAKGKMPPESYHRTVSIGFKISSKNLEKVIEFQPLEKARRKQP